MLELCDVSVYKRRYEKKGRIFKLAAPDSEKGRMVIKGVGINSRNQLEKINLCMSLAGYSDSSFTEDEINKLSPEYKEIYFKIKLLSGCEAVHFAYRPVFEDLFMVFSVCPKLKFIFIAEAHIRLLSNDCYVFIKKFINCKLEVLSLNGFRSDRLNDFYVEVYE